MKIYDRSRFYSNLVLALAVVAIMALALLVPGLDEKVQIAVVSGGIGLLTVLFRRSGLGGAPPRDEDDDEEPPPGAAGAPAASRSPAAPAVPPSPGAAGPAGLALPIFCLAFLALGACDYQLRVSPFGGSNTDYVRLTGQATTPAACASPYGCVFLDTVTGLPLLMDASTNKYYAGTAWRLRQVAGTPGSVATGDLWHDTAASSPALMWRGASGSLKVMDSAGNMAPTSLTIASAVQSGASFFKACTLTSAAAATPVVCLSAADVPASLSARLATWHAYVNGGTGWGTTTSCVIEDTSGNDLVTIAVAAMTSNTFIDDGSANVTKEARYRLGTGGASDAGLQISCNANGTGSDLVVTLSGSIQ